jgi:hypothetical protein
MVLGPVALKKICLLGEGEPIEREDFAFSWCSQLCFPLSLGFLELT